MRMQVTKIILEKWNMNKGGSFSILFSKMQNYVPTRHQV